MSAEAANPQPSYIILLSIDGMANFYLQEQQVRMPHLRSLIKQGVMADAMKSVFPTATWAIHSSIVTGTYPRKHGILGNWVMNRSTKSVGEYFSDSTWGKEDILQRETIYDTAKRLGWTTASVCWPVTREAQSIDYNIPEFYDQDLFEAYATPGLWKELKEAGLPVERYGSWSKDHARGQMQDWLTTEVAKHLIQRHKPNLMLLHYLLPDSYQHDYGTRSQEVYWSLEYIDERIGELVSTLKEEGIWEDTALCIVSDHGFVDTTKTVFPNVCFKQKGWFDPDQPEQSKVAAVSNGGSGYVYIFEEDPAMKAALMREVKQSLQEMKGVGRLFEPQDYESLGLPVEGEMEDQRPDFVFEAEMDCFIHFEHEGDLVYMEGTKFQGMHGYLPDHEELKCIFVAAGKSIPSGIQIPEIHIVDIAPTLLNMMGGEIPGIDGQAIDLNTTRKGARNGQYSNEQHESISF
ncbi:alkaline phosphatase family protein [Paenibacillus sabinae]|uniref:Type I phosphodiesterase/nucleotide pyrophosphatase n=1 Tax=Paenibacillus sabinae T27 TaxID=1268072 RepID=X4ZR97_9BACL|nr:ectonucleotide pyrophosphatase/phosphodiesterase [Paenibacillus sabinae]AHV99632.1 type I phosphodiesterase/nucleotide pyrophosphatase [Paenibacillus sabinae T27]